MNKIETVNELDRLIREASHIAPSISNLQGNPIYSTATDEALNFQASQRWELEAASLISKLAGSQAEVFLGLKTQYDCLKGESNKFHSRSIQIHKVMLLLETAKDLLNSNIAAIESPSTTTNENVEISPPEKVTFQWLFKHVSIPTIFSAVILLSTIFVAGIKASEIPFVREIVGLADQAAIPKPAEASAPSDRTFYKALQDRDPRIFSGSKDGIYYVARLLPDRASMQLDTDMRRDLNLTKTSFDMYANNAGFVLRSYNKSFEDLIKRNVNVRFLLSDWSDNANVDAHSLAVREIPDSVRADILKSKVILDEMIERFSKDRGVYKGRFEVRYTKELLLYSSWISDRNYAHIEIQFHGGKDKWPSVRFGQDSGKLVEYMATEFENLWGGARQ